MLMDQSLVIADNLDVTEETGSDLVGDQIDLGEDNSGKFLDNFKGFLVIQITEAFVGSGATVQFILASDSSATIAVDGNETRHLATDVFTIAQLTKGKRLVYTIPQGIPYERYVGLILVTGGATTTSGKITAFITTDAQQWAAYAEADS